MIPFEPPKPRPARSASISDRIMRWSLAAILVLGAGAVLGEWFDLRLLSGFCIFAVIIPILTFFAAMFWDHWKWMDRTLGESQIYGRQWRDWFGSRHRRSDKEQE